jgi:hypothetical protein
MYRTCNTLATFVENRKMGGTYQSYNASILANGNCITPTLTVALHVDESIHTSRFPP